MSSTPLRASQDNLQWSGIASNLVVVEIEDSARKWGVAEDDMRHAVRWAIRAFDLDEQFVMFIGPSRSGALLEIGVSHRTGAPRIVHAMPARNKFL